MTLYEVIGKLVISIGGIGVIITGLSTLGAKLLMDFFSKKQDSKYEQKIEVIKSELSKEIEKLKALSENASYKDKILFEMEFELYKSIAHYVSNIDIYVNRTVNLILSGSDIREIQIVEFAEAINVLHNYYTAHRAFFQRDILIDLEKFHKAALDIHAKAIQLVLPGCESKDAKDVWNNLDEIEKKSRDKVLEDVYQYFTSVRRV